MLHHDIIGHVQIDAQRADFFSVFIRQIEGRGAKHPAILRLRNVVELIGTVRRAAHDLQPQIAAAVPNLSAGYVPVFNRNDRRFIFLRPVVQHHFAIRSKLSGNQLHHAFKQSLAFLFHASIHLSTHGESPGFP